MLLDETNQINKLVFGFPNPLFSNYIIKVKTFCLPTATIRFRIVQQIVEIIFMTAKNIAK